MFQEIMFVIPLLSVASREAAKEIRELLEICKEYVVALRIEISRRAASDPLKQAELAAVFTECKIQPIHMFFGLKVAIGCAFKVNNFKTAGFFCRKFLEMSQTQRLPKSMTASVPQVSHCSNCWSNFD
jgi:coatomer protein complex subunit alpha (xenin)